MRRSRRRTSAAVVSAPIVGTVTREPLRDAADVDAIDPMPDAAPSGHDRSPMQARGNAGSADGSGTVMVPVERLDELVRMVGEAAAAHLRVGRVFTERIGVEAANLSEFAELSRLLNGLQERAMRTRMVPVSTITDSLQRAVRDAARSLGKDVRWEVRGEDTELDRGVLHQLADSLLHLVRNAVDHGIDTPEQRADGRQAGPGRGATARDATRFGGHHRRQRRRRRRRPRAGACAGRADRASPLTSWTTTTSCS